MCSDIIAGINSVGGEFMNLIEGLMKSKSEEAGVLHELHQFMGRFQVNVDLNPMVVTGEDGISRRKILKISETEPLPPRSQLDFADFCMDHNVESRLQAELQQQGIDALVVLQQGILEILTR
jgi:hypothetical protein